MSTHYVTKDTLPDLKKSGQHKFTHGHAVVLSGGPGKGGAARLAARAALRVGAGLVTLACSQRSLPEHAAQLNAVMIQPIDGPFGLEELLEDHRVTGFCLGPALGLTKTTADMVKVALSADIPTVLDADALSRFQRAPEGLFSMLHERTVLTPHGGEFKRLFPDLSERYAQMEESEDEKIAAVTEAAKRAGCVVLLKGPRTVISSADGALAVHDATGPRASPWLATAGAGDVLAGLIAGLLARGLQPQEAAAAGAWLHVEAARLFGPGLIAEDISEMIPRVLSDLEA